MQVRVWARARKNSSMANSMGKPSWIGTRRSLVDVQKSRACGAVSCDLRASPWHTRTSCSYLQLLAAPMSLSWRYRRRSMASPWSMFPATQFLHLEMLSLVWCRSPR